jgi:hypothetical protein
MHQRFSFLNPPLRRYYLSVRVHCFALAMGLVVGGHPL